MNYRQFLARCFILGRQIKKQTQVDEHVGVMMPTTVAGMVTFFSLQAYRRIPAMLNFSMGFYNLLSACNTAGIKTIYTSRQFIATAKLEILIDELQAAGLNIRFLEDFKSAIKLGHKLSGLTAGSILPLISGIKCFFYPSPLHYKIIPGLVYKTGATIMFGTDTFLTGYARAADRHDFSGVRYIFAGAEKVKPETIRYWTETFGVKIFEGYGATEASPVISVNCPFASIIGSVGMALPFMESRIEPVDGIADGGRLFLRGPNIMRGYIRADNPGTIEAPYAGWHDTGDIVTINANGFITISWI